VRFAWITSKAIFESALEPTVAFKTVQDVLDELESLAADLPVDD